jgi:carboxylesterase type B
MKVLISVIAGCIATGVFCDDLVAKLADGSQVKGSYDPNNQRMWSGIPYAEPPVGDMRWEDPLPKGPIGSYDANFMAPGCIQDCKLPQGSCSNYGYSEDCLYLTVYAPKEAPKDPAGYPVFYWIHGGAFEQGLGDCALYNGSTFAEQGVITVVPNYRLGSLGFLASKSMSGNYGLKDQNMALQWVQKNIESFGGDPKKVTVGGQSAGAMSTASHMVSKEGRGLFQQALIESNPLALPYHTRQSMGKNARAFAEYLGCEDDDVACMRTKSPSEIVEAQDKSVKLDVRNLFINFMPFSPMMDKTGYLQEQQLYALAAGQMTRMPIMGGSVKDEGQLFVQELFTKPIGDAEYQGLLRGLFGKESYPIVKNMYPMDIVPGSKDARDALNFLATDLLFLCPLRNITKGYETVERNAKKTQPTYLYRFEHTLSFDCWEPTYPYCYGKVCHGSELPMVFNAFSDGQGLTYQTTADEKKLTVDMNHYWANFIRSGNPNTGADVPVEFPLYQKETELMNVLDVPGMRVEGHIRESYCDQWDKLGYFY